MCRWLAYSGAPIYLEDLIFKPEHSLIDQSLSARSSAQTTNGDGFGIGWYGTRDNPGVYKDVQPAWNDENLRDVAAQIESGMFLAHVRAATLPATVQRSNCHPFRHGTWLFCHNGLIRGFPWMKRDLVLEISPELFPEIQGTTDSEIMFYLALTFGLEDGPVAAMGRMVGLVEALAKKKGIEHAMQMTAGLTDGERVYAFRYSSERESRTLFHSQDMSALREMFPGIEEIFSEDARAVVSEPLGDLADAWDEIAESTAVIVEAGEVEEMPFEPRKP